MTWFRVDDTLGFHHKVVAAGNPAMGLWVRAGAMCAQQLTDGFVADHMVPALGAVSQAKRLVEVGLWVRVEGGYRFHEWSQANPSREQVEKDRAAARERMQKNRSGSSHVRPNGDRTNGEVREQFAFPDPTRKEHPSDVLTSSAIASDRDDPDDPPRPEVLDLCLHLATRVQDNGHDAKVGKAWHRACRLMIDRDGHTPAQIRAAIDWATADPFWSSNIRSMQTLREKYSTLRVQAAKPKTVRSRNGIDWDAKLAAAQEADRRNAS